MKIKIWNQVWSGTYLTLLVPCNVVFPPLTGFTKALLFASLLLSLLSRDLIALFNLFSINSKFRKIDIFNFSLTNFPKITYADCGFLIGSSWLVSSTKLSSKNAESQENIFWSSIVLTSLVCGSSMSMLTMESSSDSSPSWIFCAFVKYEAFLLLFTALLLSERKESCLCNPNLLLL